jgi:DNA invertase Pin-like site-specific DNA recombinase
MPTLAAVVRVSHVGARSGDSFHADEDQVAEVKRYARDLNANVIFMEPELSVSGGEKIANRPGLLAAIEGVESGQYTGIIVANLRRLTRSRSGHEIWERVEAAGGTVHCARERLDTSNAYGRRVRDVEIANAVCEREEFADMHAERRRKTVEAGKWRQRQTPLGYSRDPDTRKLVPDENAGRVREAFADRVRGASISELAGRLAMTPSGVRQLLRNRVYLGELRDGGNVNETAHPAIVDIATFEAAQGGSVRPARANRAPALLAGLARCASCGHLLTRGGSSKVPVYTCPTRHSGTRCPRPAAATVALLDDYVERIALGELARLSVTGSEGNRAEKAQAALDDAERELAAFLSVARATDPGFAGAVEDRRGAVDTARDLLRAEVSKSAVVPSYATGADVWDSLDSRERNQLLRGLLAAVVVAPAGRGSRTPLSDRVRVLRFGADVNLPQRRGGQASGLVPIPLPDVDGPDVLRVAAGEDAV